MSNTSQERATNSYASVNGLSLYYEIHGTGGQPLVLLHGAYMTIDSAFGKILPTLAETRQVIAVELQGHGRTADIDRPLTYEHMADDTAALLRELGIQSADIDRPLTYEHMADDTAALLRELGIQSADIFGYSMGGGVALQVAIRHREFVRKLVIASATYNSEGMYPELLAMIETITPEAFAGSPPEAEYLRLAPNPDDFPTLVAKLRQLDTQIQDWSAEDIQSIKAPALVIIGDSDVVRPEHAVAMFRLLGGGVCGDLSGLPNTQLAVLPGTMHVTVIEQTDLLLAIIPPFLDAPMTDAA